MKILTILPFPALPLTHGGRVRAYRLAVALARAGAQVELACPWHPAFPRRPYLQDGITIRPFVFSANVLPKLLGDRIVPPLCQLSLQPYTAAPRQLIERTGLHDIVEFHFCAYASWMHRVPAHTRVVYSAHNVEVDYSLTEQQSSLSSFFRRRLAALERQAVRDSDFVVTCTEADARRLDEVYGLDDFEVVSNGFDEAELWGRDRPPREEIRAELGLAPDELVLVFVGGRAVHNRRAVRFLEYELLPKLNRPARLLLVGQCARPRRQGRVLSLGYVDSVVPLLAAADVAVNPIEAGSGSNVKVAEYLAAELPVVTTPVGLRGYEEFADHVTVAPLDRFADAVATAPSVVGRPPALAELSWVTLGRRLHDVYSNLLGRNRAPALMSIG